MKTDRIRILATSDIHGIPEQFKFVEADVVVITGDFSPLQNQQDTRKGGGMCTWITKKFIPWMQSLPCEHVIFIPGNHDFITEETWFEEWFNDQCPDDKIVYLCHRSFSYKGFTFHGCPHSDIPGWAWQARNSAKYMPPAGTDVMLVHQAPQFNYLGYTMTHYGWREFGSTMLMNALMEKPENLPLMLLCGHIHGGEHTPQVFQLEPDKECLMANVAMKDEDYTEHFYPCMFECAKTEDAMGNRHMEVKAYAVSGEDEGPGREFGITNRKSTKGS